MSGERREVLRETPSGDEAFDLITTGRVSVDLFPLQRASLVDVTTSRKRLGAGTTNVAVAPQRWGCAATARASIVGGNLEEASIVVDVSTPGVVAARLLTHRPHLTTIKPGPRGAVAATSTGGCLRLDPLLVTAVNGLVMAFACSSGVTRGTATESAQAQAAGG